MAGPHSGPGHAPLPPELVAHLRALGRWNEDGIGRRAQARPCTSCAVVCMTGLTSEPCAWVARCDSVPIDAVGEVLALFASPPRATYRLRWFAGRGRYELDPRYPENISAAPAGSLHPEDGTRVIVLAEHRCHAPPLPVSSAAGRALAEQARRASAPAPGPDDEPPY